MQQVDDEGNPVQFSVSQAKSIQLLYESREWLMSIIEDMNLQSKDIFLVIGPSRTGKGTLLEALKGTKMKFFHKKKFADL